MTDLMSRYNTLFSVEAEVSVLRGEADARASRLSEQRFTMDGSRALEDQLDYLCTRARQTVQDAIPASVLEAMLLGGGYGRGEGGVLRTPRGDRPYNDLEFYVFLRGPAMLMERKFQPILDHCAHALSNEAGIEIELRAGSLRKLRRSLPNMF